jgi:photosystem II stability/assembly factor-like uncharacterized protein
MHTQSRTRLSILVLLPLLALVLPVPALATGPSWTPLGPPDGSTVPALAFDPTNQAIVYAGVWGGGVFKSLDGGRNWSLSSGGLYASQVNALAVDPRDPRSVYAGTTEGFYRSHDGGRTWLPSELSRDVLAITVDSRRAGSLNIATRDGLFRSTDGGVRWVETTPAIHDVRFYAPAISAAPSQPQTVYTAYIGYRSGIFRSGDGGKTWYQVSRKVATTLSVDAGDPELVYAGGWRSKDGGLTWSALPEGFARAVAVPSRPGVAIALYRGDLHPGGGLAISEDEGRTWRLLRGLDSEIRALAISPSRPDTWLVGTSGAGVLRSDNSGETWRFGRAGLRGFAANLVRIVPERNAIFTAGGSGLYRTTNGGASWSWVLPDVLVTALAVDPSDPDTLYAGAVSRDGEDGIVYKSEDGGSTWETLVPEEPFGPISDLLVLPADPQTVYAAVWTPDAFSDRPGLFRSTDGGETWSRISGFGEVADLELDPGDPDVIYATQGRGILRSTDRGETWRLRMVGEGQPGSWARRTRQIAVAPSDSSRLAVVDPYSLWVSVDGSRSWGKARQWGPDLSRSVAFDPLDAGTIYAGISYGVLRSRDGGATWRFFSRGLPGVVINDLVFDPADPSKLYAATSSAGVFVMDLDE